MTTAEEEAALEKNTTDIHHTKDASSTKKVEIGKSCKGGLYYSSALKSKAKNPFCVGFTRSLSHVPQYIGESESKASKEGRILTDFRYGCVGYSLYKDCKNQQNNAPDSQTELPLCVGLEVLVDRRPNNAESTAVIHNKEDGQAASQRRPQKPVPTFGDEFLGRFTRNANLVAMGVLKNLRRVGNQIKDGVDDILYPYRRRPK
ncbi:hypothetical protein LIER_04287 [Lithospermum erythrorhizon]|uniref:DUF8204 domain-containing protein n=1 Tax=Lithospermum erythrorhizon TaxID=34254 RepID=A0AAV3NX12_LITER